MKKWHALRCITVDQNHVTLVSRHRWFFSCVNYNPGVNSRKDALSIPCTRSPGRKLATVTIIWGFAADGACNVPLPSYKTMAIGSHYNTQRASAHKHHRVDGGWSTAVTNEKWCQQWRGVNTRPSPKHQPAQSPRTSRFTTCHWLMRLIQSDHGCRCKDLWWTQKAKTTIRRVLKAMQVISWGKIFLERLETDKCNDSTSEAHFNNETKFIYCCCLIWTRTKKRSGAW